jgi:hypothetical protein
LSGSDLNDCGYKITYTLKTVQRFIALDPVLGAMTIESTSVTDAGLYNLMIEYMINDSDYGVTPQTTFS